VLYWYRTPPDVKVGRDPFDPDIRRALEARYPEVTFEWESIVSTPKLPPPLVEPWRERRRRMRAADPELDSEDLSSSTDSEDIEDRERGSVDATEDPAETEPELPVSAQVLATESSAVPVGDESAVPPGSASGSSTTVSSGRRRRRHRGGRRRRRPA
jgi:hypothetical protein